MSKATYRYQIKVGIPCYDGRDAWCGTAYRLHPYLFETRACARAIAARIEENHGFEVSCDLLVVMPSGDAIPVERFDFLMGGPYPAPVIYPDDMVF